MASKPTCPSLAGWYGSLGGTPLYPPKAVELSLPSMIDE